MSDSQSKGGRPATGSIKWVRDRWHAYVSMPDGSRPLKPLDPKIPFGEKGSEAYERARASARVASEWYRANPSAEGTVRETVEQYSKRWLEDREGRGVHSVADDRSRMTHHVVPLLGALDVGKFNRDDVERLRDDLDRKILLPKGQRSLSWKTAANVWTLITSMCGDMVNAKKRELRVRGDNPCRDVKPPERGAHKEKQFLYPSEFLTFVTCRDVPRRWRRAVTLAIYTYGRDGEVSALRWDAGDVDLAHGTLRIVRARDRVSGADKGTKTGNTRRFSVEPTLLPLLETMHRESGGKGRVFDLDATHLSRTFRRWLKVAKVDRPELHDPSPTSKPMTWHDLRATGATWMAVRGDDPLKIKQRCGHSTFSTTERYIRTAEAVVEGFGDPFPGLPEVLIRFCESQNLKRRIGLKQGLPGAGHGSRTRDLQLGKLALYQLS